ncbi:MAG TPA: cytochrome c oxidase subunit 3, partial [Ignavibacteria bacterium]|nr:cytochrome c oxidase subunit 3 [Ignavibacteria bacterium]
FEWGTKFQHGIYPKGPEMVTLPNGQVLYFGLYFTMTGLHALHVLVGMVFLAVILILIIREKINMDNHQKFENAGLFWHLVDIIWIFLFPLFYLIH